ncbi:MAG: hypothetical protein H6813_06995 [Phycisphaeraceae bacterium]|nr:hypothetical protein [Phycisphaeraceae bacterium]
MSATPSTYLISCALLAGAAHAALGAVERYKVESEYLARLAELGLDTVQEGFESSVWDGSRYTIVDPHHLVQAESQGILWEPAARDVWGGGFGFHQHGLSTTPNWARSGGWGLFEDHGGDPYPTTIRLTTPVPIFGVGGWYNTNPDGENVGILFDDRTTANAPGYFLPGFGAMYPGDNPSFGHVFVGFIDPDGFTNVILTGVIQVNEKGILEGGAIFGCDDFTIGVPQGFITPPCPGDINGDGAVDTADLGILLGDFGSNNTQSDLNSDGIIDTADLGVLLNGFGETGCL